MPLVHHAVVLAVLLAAHGAEAGRQLLLAPSMESKLQEVSVTQTRAPAGEASSAMTPATTPAPVTPIDSETFTGDGTAYSERVPNSGSGFACSFRYMNDWASVHFAAINAEQWDEGRACGRCVAVSCTDPMCKTQGSEVVVRIVDKCPECKKGDLDFSIPVYREITGMWPHRLRVQWRWADCADFIDGPIHVDPKDGQNPYFQALYLSNAKYPLQKVLLNGVELDRQQFGFWQRHGQLGSGDLELEVHAQNGKMTRGTIKSTLEHAEIPQFA